MGIEAITTLSQTRPPGPAARHPIANVRPFLRHRADFILDMARNYGDVAYFKLGLFNVYLVNDPAAVQEILVTKSDCFGRSAAARFSRRILGNGLLTSDGAFHKRQRRLVQPVFHRQRIGRYAEAMVDHAQRLSTRWRDGESVDMAREMMRLTLSIVAETLFTTRDENEARIVEQSLESFIGLVDRIANPAGAILNLLPLPSNRRFKGTKRALDAMIYGLIESRRSANDPPDDLLTRLVRAKDEDDGAVMTDEQIRDEVLALFLAGHETTSLWLTWTWSMLAEHPTVSERVHEELDTVLAGRAPTPEDLPALPYLHRVLKETLRLFPPAYLFDREALVDFEANGYVIPKGAIAMMSPYAMHRHPAYWPEPERFDPDRWAAPDTERPRFAYFPFGGGPHVCIGEGFAWLEAPLLLAVLAQHWTATRTVATPWESDPVVTLRPKGGAPMTLHRR